jgi:capsular polysaccharide transport system permease protein
MSTSGKFFGLGRAGGAVAQPMYLIDHVLIIRAIVLRNLRLKYLNQPTGFVVEFLRPAIACVAHYFVFWAVQKQMPPGISLEEYIWAAFLVWFPIIQTYGGLQQPNRTKAPPFLGVSPMHMRLAICAWAVILNATFCYISVSLMIIFGDNIGFPSVPLTALILLLAAMLGFGLGLFVEGICRAVPLVAPLFHLMPYFLFISAGIYYSAATAPPALARIFVFSPTLHLVEYERYAFDPGYPISLVSLSYPAACAASFLLLGLATNRRLRYKREG